MSADKTASGAYNEFRRIHIEQGIQLPVWESLKHVNRTAWEAVKQYYACPEIDRQEQAQRK